MSTFMFQLANAMMNFINSAPLGANGTNPQWGNNTTLPNWVKDIVGFIDQMLYPILVVVGTAGAIYAVYLGVNLARADSADKQQEAKKRMINAIIGLASIIALILLLKLFLWFLPEWLNASIVTTPTTTPSK